MNIKPLPKTPRIPTQLTEEGGASFVKALFNVLLESNTTVNAIINKLAGEEWRTVTLINGWADYPAHASASYFKDGLDVVHLRGATKDGAGVLAVLPVGYRPPFPHFAVGISAGNTACRVSVATNGEITIGGGSNAFVSLDGISFKAAT